MKTTDPRDLTWQEIQDSLEGTRETVRLALDAYGPATTSQLAEITGVSLFTVRPRVTELAQLGLAKCIGRRRREGLYQAIPLDEAMAAHASLQRDSQLPLKLPTTQQAT